MCIRDRLAAVSEHTGLGSGSGCMETAQETRDPEDEAVQAAEHVVYGWPTVDREPTPMWDEGAHCEVAPPCSSRWV